MPWFKVDDQLATHPKVMRAGLTAMGLWVIAGSWSARYLTDGHIPADALPMLLRATPRQADALVKAGLWLRDADGWRFKDWAEYQPAAVDAAAYRAAMSNGAVRGNHYRWHVRRGISNPGCPLCRFADDPPG